ncbi:Response regulator rcp1 [Stieleria maiorica]|uniref:Response regulator rcp1 n=1 Tax=Stieleria maiorica TaxID=2795974 RepID=A0A5B9MGQ7_9BACT|nr:response regulator [Stieleria maiorica]QEF98247.1 Response regulator rcp1 [Stieleria maiorica]
MNHPNAKRKPAVILLVEDDPGDQELTRRALKHESFNVDLRIAGDGEQAMDYLRREGAFADPESSPTPDLILLDLNMPKRNGREVLGDLQADETLSRIPVVVLTTSEQEADILRSYDLGCNSYIQKPVDIDQFTESVRRLGSYWFGVVTLPTPNVAV